MTVKFITSKEAAEIIKDGSTIAVGGFIGTGVAEENTRIYWTIL